MIGLTCLIRGIRAVGIAVTFAISAKAQGTVSGIVVDSAGRPLEAVEVRLVELNRRAFSMANGSFRFENVGPGRWAIAVRRIGFLPQQQLALVDSGPALTFRLIPTVAVLPPLVTAASQLGLGGTVVDTAGNAVRGARVRILGTGHSAETDSAGRFWVSVPAGSYMVAVSKDKFAQRLAGVTIPTDSGRRIAVWLRAATPVLVREAWNVEDMRERLAFVPQSRRFLYTRESMEAQEIKDVFDAVRRLASRFDLRKPLHPDCMVVVDGGPAVERLGSLRADQIELVEVYQRYSNNTATSRGARFNQRSNTDDAIRMNRGLTCLGVYVWLR